MLYFTSRREASEFFAFFALLMASVFASVFAITHHLMHPVWMFHAPFTVMLLLYLLKKELRNGAYFPCTPGTLLGSLLAVLTAFGILVQVGVLA